MRNKTLYWMLSLLPLLYMIYRLGFGIESLAPLSEMLYTLSGKLLKTFPDDPVKFISDITGLTGLFFLALTLSLPLLKKYLKINMLAKRRFFGLFTFFYAFLHMLLYLILDHEWNLFALWNEALDKQFIFFGMISFLILLFMAATSTRKLFARFRSYHQLIYVVAICISLHYYLSQKFMTVTSSSAVFLILTIVTVKLIGKRYNYFKK